MDDVDYDAEGSWTVVVDGAPTLRVEWEGFAPSDDLVLALYDRATRALPIPAGFEVVYPPAATSSAPAVVGPQVGLRC